ncbi:hypothetical protein HII36_08875 [Nonomuraea sp. NN258]|uniref:hypothetical protein n=1 Tax=Nonomuraea antri TaxID=2730852 RepID=UPI001569850C|nr:hypothetical protein [Nonomuraea antri]NRQ31952.1 hypothetical protein [Nonomuraea antri]
MLSRDLLDELNRATTPIRRPHPLVVLWRWRYEAALLVLLVCLVAAAGTVSLAAAAVPVAIVLWPQARSGAWGRIRCVVTAHRIRVGLVQAYVVSRHGKIPAVLWCAPAPFGERVWLWCRAGTTAGQVEQGREVIAAACWATEVLVHPSPSNPHRVLLDVVRQGRAGAAGQAPLLPARARGPRQERGLR